MGPYRLRAGERFGTDPYGEGVMVCLGGWVCGVEVSSGVRSSDDSKDDSIFVEEFDRFKAEAARESKPSDPLK
jgi:hypothetical protein